MPPCASLRSESESTGCGNQPILARKSGPTIAGRCSSTEWRRDANTNWRSRSPSRANHSDTPKSAVETGDRKSAVGDTHGVSARQARAELLETTIGAMTTSDLFTVSAHLRGTADRKRQHMLRDDSVGATASASGSTRPNSGHWPVRWPTMLSAQPDIRRSATVPVEAAFLPYHCSA